jgi:membrane protein
LAAPIAFLLATFFIALAIIIGAHLNAALENELPSWRERDERAGGTDARSAGAPLGDPIVEVPRPRSAPETDGHVPGGE